MELLSKVVADESTVSWKITNYYTKELRGEVIHIYEYEEQFRPLSASGEPVPLEFAVAFVKRGNKWFWLSWDTAKNEPSGNEWLNAR